MTSPLGSPTPGSPAGPPARGPAEQALIGGGWAPARPSTTPSPSRPASPEPAAAEPGSLEPLAPEAVASGSVAAGSLASGTHAPGAAAQPVPPAGPVAELPREPRPAPDGPVPAPTGSTASQEPPTTVLPAAGGTASVRRPAPARPAPRPSAADTSRTSRASDSSSRASGKSRRARLALQRIDPWSVFLYTLVASVFLGVALVVAAFVLYSVLGALGVPETVNELYLELAGDEDSAALLTSGRVLTAAAVLAAVNVVLLTLLATLGALLYNLCASFTGGIEVTLGERDS